MMKRLTFSPTICATNEKHLVNFYGVLRHNILLQVLSWQSVNMHKLKLKFSFCKSSFAESKCKLDKFVQQTYLS